jgi:HK97 family phage prohead protease
MNAIIRAAPDLKHAPLRQGGMAATGDVISGYASIFGSVDLGNDRVARGAFASALRKRGAGGIRMLFQHDPAEIIGSWIDIREDAFGLRVRGRINAEVARGREVLALIRQGALDGLSIGFKTIAADQDRATGVRTIREADLWEISVVTFPMLPEARISELKAQAHGEPTGEMPMLAALIRKAAHTLNKGTGHDKA